MRLLRQLARLFREFSDIMDHARTGRTPVDRAGNRPQVARPGGTAER